MVFYQKLLGQSDDDAFDKGIGRLLDASKTVASGKITVASGKVDGLKNTQLQARAARAHALRHTHAYPTFAEKKTVPEAVSALGVHRWGYRCSSRS